MKENKCIGCGSILQSNDEKLPGYIKKEILENRTSDILCQRCFRLKHYRDMQDVDISHEEFVKILNKIASIDALVINVVDLFDLSGSLISGIHRHVGFNDLILVGNKRDVLPKSINNEKIKNWIRRIIKDYGYKDILDIVLTSAEKGHGIDDLLKLINKYQNGRDVYIIGCTNVGKSTLVNAIIKRLSENSRDIITVSQFPGTTLGLIEIPFNNNLIIDTPGIINDCQYAFYLDKQNLKHIMPRKEIKPKVYQLESKQTLFFDGLARIDFTRGEKTSFVCYFSNDVNIHRTKLENADKIFNKHIGKLFNPPTEAEYQTLKPYRKHYFKITNKCDIVISGLGFISIKSPNLHITVHAPNNVGIFIRPSLW